MKKGIVKLGLLAGFAGLALTSGAFIANRMQADDGFVDPITYADAPARDRILRANDEEDYDVDKITIHYHNEDGKNDDRAFWIWSTAMGCNENYLPTKISSDKKDMEITIEFKDQFKDLKDPQGIYLIVKYKNTWDGQSEDTFIEYATFQPDDNKAVEVWIVPGVGKALEVYHTEAETKTDKVTEAYFSDYKTLKVFATYAPTKWRLYSYDQAYLEMDSSSQDNMKGTRLLKEGDKVSTKKSGDGVTFDIKLNKTIHINMQYVLETEYPNRTTKDGEINNEGKVHSVNATYYRLYELGQTKTSTAKCRFVQYYTYNAADNKDLGVTYAEDKSTFKVWAPTAGCVTLNIYNNPVSKAYDAKEGGSFKKSYSMNYMAKGVWAAEVTGDLNGKYYTYTVQNSSGKAECVDPYARACGANGQRGMILDFSKTNPEGWDAISGNWNKKGAGFAMSTPQELAIYESHVRDLTMHATWEGKNARGTYAAYAERGVEYTKGTTTVKTGFDHLVELGINAIQFTPVFDHDGTEYLRKVKVDGENKPIVDEATGETEYEIIKGKDTAYNWGYDPVNYNCVEGQYATDPLDGSSRVKEFKQLIYQMATVKDGNKAKPIRAIMDVVYNHVVSASSSNFTKLMPRYYFRLQANGDYYNGSGCGNEVKSEAPMMSKFIVDSLCWWASEYNIKGFRFDLMALIDCNTLATAAKELYKIDPSIYLYGEGWTGEYGLDNAHVDESKYNTWGANTYCTYRDLNPAKLGTKACYIGCFNDNGRDALRGKNDRGWVDEKTDPVGHRLPDYGFMQKGDDVGGASDEVAAMLAGTNGGRFNADKRSESPINENYSGLQTVNYASCHDNYSLFDQYSGTLGEALTDVEKVLAATTATNMAIMMSNGVAFMQGGEELFRTKEVDAEDAEIIRLPEDYVPLNGHNIAHNAYKCKDNPTNAFDWSRKISVTYKPKGTGAADSTVNNVKSMFFDQLAKTISYRRDLKFSAKVYKDSAGGKWMNGNGSNAWNFFSGSHAVGFYNAGGYKLALIGRGGSISWSETSASANVYVDISGGYCSGSFGAAVFKLS